MSFSDRPIERDEPPVGRGAGDQRSRLSLAGRSSIPGEELGTGNWLVRLSGFGWLTRLTDDSGEDGDPDGNELWAGVDGRGRVLGPGGIEPRLDEIGSFGCMGELSSSEVSGVRPGSGGSHGPEVWDGEPWVSLWIQSLRQRRARFSPCS